MGSFLLFGSGKNPKFVAFLGARGPDRAPSDSARVLIAEVTEWLASFWSSIGIDKIILGAASLTPESINTTANLKMEKLDAGWAITAIHLDVSARVPKADDAAFQKAAADAKAGCPVSKVLNANITTSAKLER